METSQGPRHSHIWKHSEKKCLHPAALWGLSWSSGKPFSLLGEGFEHSDNSHHYVFSFSSKMQLLCSSFFQLWSSLLLIQPIFPQVQLVNYIRHKNFTLLSVDQFSVLSSPESPVIEAVEVLFLSHINTINQKQVPYYHHGFENCRESSCFPPKVGNWHNNSIAEHVKSCLFYTSIGIEQLRVSVKKPFQTCWDSWTCTTLSLLVSKPNKCVTFNMERQVSS